MKTSLGKTIGWIALVAGAIWLVVGIRETLGATQDRDVFANIALPLFAMISASLLISGVMDRR